MANVYKALVALLPGNPLLVGEVVNASGQELRIQLPDGALATARGAYSVGDTVSFPNHRNRVYRVVSRHCNAGADMGEAEWLVRIEPVR